MDKIINKQIIKERNRNRKLIERSTIFSITLIGFLTFAIFDFFFSYKFRIDGFKDLQWFGYWTHLTNLLALIWITLAFISVVFNIEGLEKNLQHWNIKNTVFTFIIVTGLVFMIVAFLPVVIEYSKAGPIKELQELSLQMANAGYIQGYTIPNITSINEVEEHATEIYNFLNLNEYTTTSGYILNTDASNTYRTMVIVGTTFKHLIIPGMFIYLAIVEIGYYRTRALNDKQRSMIQFIWPCFYLIYAVTLSSCGVISPPYLVLDFGFTYGFYYHFIFDGTTIDVVTVPLLLQNLYILTAASLDIFVGVIFVLVSFTQNKWNGYILEKNVEIE